MIDFEINGIVLRVKSKALGELGDISVLGRTLSDWVGGAFDVPFKCVDFARAVNAAEKLRAAADRNKPVTVVLYCDTPLVTAKTLAAAVKKLRDDNINALRLPRGFVFKTDYLFDTDALFLQSEEPTDGEFKTVTDAESLSGVTDVLKKRILRYHASNGVRIADFNNTYIDCDAVIARDVTIEPYNFIKGKTVIKEGAHILPGNYIENSIIGERAQIDSSRLYMSSVGMDTHVGPFAYLRPDSVVGAACRIGDFVELKNCIIGDGTKVSHLTYIGDAQLGNDCNVGCGVVFANYDGRNKYRSVVGNRVFIGSNANIVAPVAIADRAFIAAGSTITKGVPKQALAIARARQSVINNWSGNVYAPPIDGQD
ncbi:MAG: hypothetical protein J1G38_04820 [Clostridiales bacterium]|nr:hypothetical protein [Clostridiales bacterium]